jgi:cell volume regulation protein A
MAVVAHLLFGMSWELAVLLGAVTSPTDAAAVFSVLRRVPLPRRLNATLEAESGLNDAPTVVLVTLVSAGGNHNAVSFAGEVVMELAIGLAIGAAVGYAGAWLMRRAALPASGLYPLAVLSLTVFAYASSAVLHGSGFAGVYVAALVLGNSELPHRAATRSFAEGMAWLAQIGLFVMLGLLATPHELRDSILPALGVGLVLLLVARPLAVLASVSWLGSRLPEIALLSWAGLRGAVPVVLATVPGDDKIFNLVFVLVVVYTLVQAPTLPWVARRLGLTSDAGATSLDIESSPLVRLDADLLQTHIAEGSRLAGVEVFELRLPPGASVTLVVREGRAFVPQDNTPLRVGDDLILVAVESVRRDVERRLRDVSRGGRLAGWNRLRRG